ncbi:MAG: 1-acyl-sn-glycerol-3-phosphate acyltransferase [Clostridia bacterium]|nr:1-acyl-sn-glycerol-3-phosphate acyltransferase [Clostridia bacterium]
MHKPIIPIFYACDRRFLKYCVVSLHSLMQNASDAFRYRVYILHTDIDETAQAEMRIRTKPNFELIFEDVSEYLHSIAHKLPLRDYYSKTTYFRLFIADMHPEYDKAIYIDADTIVQGDMSELFATDLGDNYLGACHEQAMVQVEEYGEYVEKCVGVSRYNFFNAGLLLINCEAFRSHLLLYRFINELHVYDFVVTQDEDYLNLVCKDRVLFLDQRWNTETFGEITYPLAEAHVLHYIMFNKPWHYPDCPGADIFFRYAKETPVYETLLRELEAYSPEDRQRDMRGYENLLALAKRETNNPDNYLNKLNREKRSRDRVEIVKKIEEYERAGRFSEDVEADPPSKPLLPDDIDYLRRSRLERLKTKLAFATAHKLVARLMEDKKMIIKEMRGLENFKNLQSGAVITCNHFNAFDSFAIQLVYEAAEQPDRTFFRVIREGNYTSFPGFYGFLMRHCNTLPLSSDIRTMKKFIEATNTLLKEGHFVLIYPEQSMWWNYRKPKPLKDGAFTFAARNGVPVLPCFITMKDTDIIGEGGFYVQEYTVHVSEPIYPDPALSYRKNVEMMKAKNYAIWKEIYEREYQMPLVYTTKPAAEVPVQKPKAAEA